MMPLELMSPGERGKSTILVGLRALKPLQKGETNVNLVANNSHHFP